MQLCELTLSQALEGLSAGKFTSRELTQSCLDRIAVLNPVLNVFLALNPNALSDADQADTQRASGIHLPLLGIPIAIKDNFLTQGLTTTASSQILSDYTPQYEATVVSRLKKAGCIILGKTNMDAWAHGSSTETSDFGPTLNPHDPTRLPGGSSGGSAAAVAAHMCIAALGSETAGSIRQPAAWCGVTGFKPTYGRASRYGVISMASSTDSPGPIAKTVSDCALFAQVISGFDPFDATTSDTPVSSWYQDICSSSQSLKDLRIGLATDYLLPEMSSQIKDLIASAAQVFESLGAKVIPVSLLHPKYSIGVYTILQRSEVSSNLARFDGIRYGKDRSYFSQEAKRRIMLGTYSLSSGYYDQYYSKAQKVRTLIVEDFQKAFDQVDIIIGPTSPGPALPVGATKNQPMFGEMEDMLVEPSSIAGLTAINVPCGYLDQLPIGLDIIGPQFEEYRVLHAAHAYQMSTNWHTVYPKLDSLITKK